MSDTPSTKETAERSSTMGAFLASLFTSREIVWFLGGLLVLAGIVYAALQIPSHGVASSTAIQEPGARVAVEDTARLDAIEGRLAEVESKVQALQTQDESAAAAAPLPESVLPVEAGTVPASPALEALAGDVAALRTTLNGLQANATQTQQGAEAARHAVREDIRLALAFSAVRAASVTGGGFADAYHGLVEAASADPALLASVQGLRDFAEDGALPYDALRAAWEAHGPEIRAALRRTEAQGWSDRVLAEVKNLVSIRPLHAVPDAADPLDAVTRALESRRGDDALGRLDALPDEARATLADWRAQLETRRALDRAVKQAGEALDRRLSGAAAGAS